MRNRVVLLCGDDPVSRIVYHALAGSVSLAGVVVEDRVPRTTLARRRLRTLGLPTLTGQVLFSTLLLPVLRRRAAARIAAIKGEHGLDDGPISGDVTRVRSVNSLEARDALKALAPDVVVVNGTRIIEPETLQVCSATFLNMHAGITPLYRGVHGGYWALAERRPELTGTTVHLVSRGIDTGRVVGQATFRPGAEDSFATYPYLHAGCGLPILLDAVRKAAEGTLKTARNPKRLSSRLRSHPTLWGYLARRAIHRVR